MVETLKDYLKSLHPDLSNREIKRALEQGACKVNGAIERFPNRTINKRKDKIQFSYIKPKAKPKLEIHQSEIVYENESILVYNKDSGYACMATEGKKQANLHDELKKFTKLKFLEPVHRLDRDTSGLMIFAKNKSSVEIFNDLFKSKEIHKEYYAVVDGKWSHKTEGRIETQLELASKKGSMQFWQASKEPSRNSKLAITDYKLCSANQDHSTLILKPLTGRTHQLRVHMAWVGHPILGDTQYAKFFRCKKIPGRVMLHAWRLSFTDPQTGKKLKLEASLPKEFELK